MLYASWCRDDTTKILSCSIALMYQNTVIHPVMQQYSFISNSHSIVHLCASAVMEQLVWTNHQCLLPVCALLFVIRLVISWKYNILHYIYYIYMGNFILIFRHTLLNVICCNCRSTAACCCDNPFDENWTPPVSRICFVSSAFLMKLKINHQP